MTSSFNLIVTLIHLLSFPILLILSQLPQHCALIYAGASLLTLGRVFFVVVAILLSFSPSFPYLQSL